MYDSYSVYIPAQRGGFQVGILQSLLVCADLSNAMLDGVLCGVMYVRQGHDAQGSACQ